MHLTKHKVLTISGERSSASNETSADGFKRVERQSGSIVRKFQLPDNVDIQNIEAKLQDGVLTLTVPKTAADEPTDQEIKIHAATEGTHDATHTAAAEKLQSKSRETEVEKSDERPGMGCPVEWPPRITVSYNANPKRHREANATESAAPPPSAVAAAPAASS